MATRLSATAQAAYDAAFEAAKNTALDDAFNLMDGGAAAGTIKVYSGTVPGTAGDVTGMTLLATFTCADPAFGAAASAVKTLDADPDLNTTTVAAGTPSYAVGADSTGAFVFDGEVGTSGKEFTTSSSPWTSSQTVDLTTGTQSIV